MQRVAKWLLVTSMVAPLTFTPAAGAQVLNLPGGDQISGWGVGGIQTVGQTFTAPNTRLDGFTFWVRHEAGPPFSFLAYVFAWDAATLRATGPALFVSAPMASPPPPPPLVPPVPPVFLPYAFASNVSLTPGAEYVAFMSVSGFNGLFASVESGATDVYPGGRFVYTNQPPMLVAWNTYTGVGTPPPRDLRFMAAFSAVPEPTTAVLVALGMAGMGLAWRGRRRTD